jgi:hypothetical protein
MQDDGSRRELYDLDADKHEAKNIAANQPVLVKRLSLALQTWRETLPSPSMPRQVPVE